MARSVRQPILDRGRCLHALSGQPYARHVDAAESDQAPHEVERARARAGACGAAPERRPDERRPARAAGERPSATAASAGSSPGCSDGEGILPGGARAPGRRGGDRAATRRRARARPARVARSSSRRSATRSTTCACTPTARRGALARAVSARAFTVGSDIFFAPGEYQPGTRDGDELIAHEVAHVVQQRGAPDERAADRLAAGRRAGARGRGQSRVTSPPEAPTAWLRLPRRRGCARRSGRRGRRPESRRPAPRPLHLRRAGAVAGRAASTAVDADAAAGDRRGRRLRARRARHRGARGLRRARAAPRYGRLYAYLQDDVTRRLRQPAAGRPPARAATASSRADVLACFGRTARLRAQRRAAPARRPTRPTPLADRPVKVADRLAALPARRRRRWPRPARRSPLRRVARRSRCASGASRRSPRCAALLARRAPRLPLVVVRARRRGAWSPRPRARRWCSSTCTTSSDPELMPDAALAAALEGRPARASTGSSDLEPAERAPAAARARRARASAVVCAPHRAARRSRSATARCCSSTSRCRPSPSAAAPGALHRRRGRRRRRRQVPALDRPDRAGRPRSAGSPPRARGASRRRRRRTSTSARGTPRRRGSASSPRGSTPRFRWDDLVLPDAPARGAALDLGLPAPPRPRALGVGLRAHGRAHPGPQGAVRRRVRHRQDDGRAGARGASSGLELFRVDLATVVSKYIGETEKNLDRIFARRRRLQRDPLLRRGRRAVRQALRGHGRPRPLREHRGRLPAAAHGGLPGRGHPRDELPPATSTTRSCAGSTSSSTSRSPRPTTASGSGGCCCPQRGAASPTTSTSTSSPRSSSSPAARSATARWPPRSWPPTRTRRSRCATSCARVAQEYGKQGRLTLEADFERFHELIRPGGLAGPADGRDPDG